MTARSFLRKLLLDSEFFFCRLAKALCSLSVYVKVRRDAVVKHIARVVSLTVRQGPAAFKCRSTPVAES